LHHKLPFLQAKYAAGEAAMIANVGPLVEPISKEQYLARQRETPPDLFSHNVQTRVTQSVHAQSVGAHGVLGRIVDALGTRPPQSDAAAAAGAAGAAASAAPFAASSYSISGIAKMVEGKASAPSMLSEWNGVVRLNAFSDLGDDISEMIAERSSSLMGETYAMQLGHALNNTESLGERVEDVVLNVRLISLITSSRITLP
jgi:uncharacterized protein (DUF1501 family)